MKFTKMHGLGNDFVVINNINHLLTFDTPMIKMLADRHIGIGCDQLLIIEPSQQANFFCRIYNSDGSEAEQCGNGLRCVARFLHEENIHANEILTIETRAGIFPIKINNYDHIRVTMGIPTIQENSTPLPISIVSMGNPHAIVNTVNVDINALATLATDIATQPIFPNGVNIGFMQIINKHHAKLRTIERGAGETLACGSNACAAAVTGILNNWLEQPVTIEFKYGNLMVEWEGEGRPLHLTGPATRVFSGEI